MRNEVTKITIKNFKIFQPYILKNSNKLIEKDNDNFDIDNYLFFPILLNPDKSLWKLANRYLLYKLKSFEIPSPKTLDTIATDLKDFKNYCNSEGIDYLDVPRKVFSPIKRYKKHLMIKLYNNMISPNTIKRRISSVTAFYDWLIKYENIKFKFPLWSEGETYISYQDTYGKTNYKRVKTKDIMQVPKNNKLELSDDSIIDGGKLFPLNINEQKVLISLLKECNNIEMFLSFLIALSTGARMQTVFTLRLKHFTRVINNDENIVRIKVGYGTHCDTKYSKRNTLFLPVWLYKRIQSYINSQRAIKKRNKSKHIFSDNNLQYLFLTAKGTPYYCANDDKYKILYKSPPSGETVRMFINNTLKKKYKEKNFILNFSFHDLRATFGMNLVDSYLPLLKEKEISLTQILNIVKERMGHANLKTTELYLNFRNKNKNTIKAQNNYEEFLRELLNE